MQGPGIDKEPAFEWWVPHTLKKRQVILAALKKRIRKETHKYGIKSLHVLSMPMNLTEKMETTSGKKALKWKCTTLVLHLKS